MEQTPSSQVSPRKTSKTQLHFHINRWAMLRKACNSNKEFFCWIKSLYCFFGGPKTKNMRANFSNFDFFLKFSPYTFNCM